MSLVVAAFVNWKIRYFLAARQKLKGIRQKKTEKVNVDVRKAVWSFGWYEIRGGIYVRALPTFSRDFCLDSDLYLTCHADTGIHLPLK